MADRADSEEIRARVAASRRLLTAFGLSAVLDFEVASLEWRPLFSELFGTFLLVMVGAGAGVVDAVSHGEISRAAAVVSPGLMVTAIILFMGAVSGAHLNPAVTIGFTLRGDFPWRRVPSYIVMQLLGATFAVLFLDGVFGTAGHLGQTVPGPHVHDWQAMLIELVLTLGLVSTILGTASRAQNVGALSAVAVGGYIALAGLWSSPISGAVMNPARAFGPALVLGDFSHFWVYLAGPLAGGSLAVAAAWLLRGRGGDAGGLAAARGTLDARVQEALASRAREEGTSAHGQGRDEDTGAH